MSSHHSRFFSFGKYLYFKYLSISTAYHSSISLSFLVSSQHIPPSIHPSCICVHSSLNSSPLRPVFFHPSVLLCLNHLHPSTPSSIHLFDNSALFPLSGHNLQSSFSPLLHPYISHQSNVLSIRPVPSSSSLVLMCFYRLPAALTVHCQMTEDTVVTPFVTAAVFPLSLSVYLSP